jgi:hypothetical protein
MRVEFNINSVLLLIIFCMAGKCNEQKHHTHDSGYSDSFRLCIGISSGGYLYGGLDNIDHAGYVRGTLWKKPFNLVATADV